MQLLCELRVVLWLQAPGSSTPAGDTRLLTKHPRAHLYCSGCSWQNTTLSVLRGSWSAMMALVRRSATCFTTSTSCRRRFSACSRGCCLRWAQMYAGQSTNSTIAPGKLTSHASASAFTSQDQHRIQIVAAKLLTTPEAALTHLDHLVVGGCRGLPALDGACKQKKTHVPHEVRFIPYCDDTRQRQQG